MKKIQEQNYFILNPRAIRGTTKQHVVIDYSPLFSEVKHCMMDTIPILNTDHDPAQPGFILKIDEPLHQQHRLQYQQQYQKKYEELTMKSKTMNLPKPKSFSKFCNLCKLHYIEYLDHIQSKNHKVSFTKNTYINKIEQIAQEFKQYSIIEQCESTEIEPRKVKKINL